MDARLGVIAIEASDPVPYVASQPDPQQFVIELRDIVAAGFADNFKADPRHPFSAVQVETTKDASGASVARVHVALLQPLRPRVRSARNVIYIEADRLDRPANMTNAIVNGSNPSSAIRDIRVARRGTATAVTLHSTGRLMVSGVEESKEGPPKLYIDLPNATSALSGTTPIGAGPVDAVRVGLNIKNPLVTRVTMDLTRSAPYRIETSENGNDLTVVFDPPDGNGRPRPRLPRAGCCRRHRRRLRRRDRRLRRCRPRPVSPRRRSRPRPLRVRRDSRRSPSLRRSALPAFRSALIFRELTCAPCSARSPRSAA